MHRLDRETSGALVLARTADAAAWLSACFREHAENAETASTVTSPAGAKTVYGRVTHVVATAASKSRKSEAASGQSVGAAAAGAAVQRMYWAIVETGGVLGGVLPESGRVVAPIRGGAGSGSDDPGRGGSWRPASTSFHVLQQVGGYALLELRPQTGRGRLHLCHELLQVSTDSSRLLLGCLACACLQWLRKLHREQSNS